MNPSKDISIVASLHPQYFSMSEEDKVEWVMSLLEDVAGPASDDGDDFQSAD